ncbi:MAG: YebC/PmpR family DNA-binding transcriptional regulator [Verrucomicrobiales bacterium]
MGAQWKQKWRELNADRKGRMVNKLVKEIQVAAKLGGPNPEFNARLSAAIETAKKASVFKDTIERAIAKGAGTDGTGGAFETLLFEGFAPHHVPVMVECLTDNSNRTTPEIKVLFRGGNLGNKGSVAWMFEHVGLIEAHHADSSIDIEMAALEAEADNVELLAAEERAELSEGRIAARFFCGASALDAVGKALIAKGWTSTTSELVYHPKDFPPLTDAQHNQVAGFLQQLDDHPDVHRIYPAMR